MERLTVQQRWIIAMVALVDRGRLPRGYFIYWVAIVENHPVVQALAPLRGAGGRRLSRFAAYAWPRTPRAE